MQVSSRSWHIRLVRLLDEHYQPKNLCKHFWAVLLMMAVLPLLGVLIVGIALILGAILILHFPIYGTGAIQKFLNEDSTIRPWWLRAGKKSKTTKEPKPKKHHEPNIFIEWVKAKKNRVCPLIEVVEVGEGE